MAGWGGAPPAMDIACFMISRMTPLRGVVRADEGNPFFSPWEGDGSGGRPRRASVWSTLQPPEQQSLSRAAILAGSPGEMLCPSYSSYRHIMQSGRDGRKATVPRVASGCI